MEKCAICNLDLHGKPSVVLRSKGCIGINQASAARGDSLHVQDGQEVHQGCRKTYTNPNVIRQSLCQQSCESEERTTRSKMSSFLFSEHCLFCGQYARLSGKKRSFEVHSVRTLEFQKTIQKVCKERADDWANDVQGRLESVNDLPAADALYHQQCNVNFRTGRQIPKHCRIGTEKRQKFSPTTPGNSCRHDAFIKVTEYIKDNDNQQITVNNLVQFMEKLIGDGAYTHDYMKHKLQEYFGDSIIMTEINGKSNVVTFKSTAETILQDYYRQPREEDTSAEKLKLIKTAAKLIMTDIKDINISKENYPSSEEMLSIQQNIEYLPDSLKTLLRSMISEKDAVKIASIGQAIIQAARPRLLLTPLQIGLGVQLHHHFASKYLIETLYALGFCSSYSEVQRFETSAAAHQGSSITQDQQGGFLQFVADNVDHNVRTLDGHNTFHGMGMIACTTPANGSVTKVPRIHATPEDLCALGHINIKYYKLQDDFLSALKYDKLCEVEATYSSLIVDLLSKLTWKPQNLMPGWSGMMQMIHHGSHQGKSSITFLPMIDMNPSDLSCIYSTLTFISEQAYNNGSKPVITFDQPLYWKAFTIVNNEPVQSNLKKIILRLGGFHTEMSFLGCIGYVMGGAGLQETLETVYAPNAVVHMLSGKAIARAVRGHLLVSKALNYLLVNKAKESDTDVTQECDGPPTSTLTDHLCDAAALFEKMMDEQISPTDIEDRPSLTHIQEKLCKTKKSLSHSRTASLWLLYMDMVDILKKFLTGERTGNWNLHLQAVMEMLPFFASCGHNMYTKSAYIYVQSMQRLQHDHPDIYLAFLSGHHVIRRSDRYWAGLSSDLVIEQVLMRSLKSTGGMTRGHGMGESQRSQWLLSRPACVEVNNAMQSLTNIGYHSSDQHKDTTKSRKARDDKDSSTIVSFLEERSPFNEDPSLRNIATGVTADDSVNIEQSQVIGEKILQSMCGEKVVKYSFKKANQAVPLNTKVAIKSDTDLHIDHQLLFQRLVTAADTMLDNIPDMFSYELSSFPSSLFDTSGLMREAQKSVMAESIWKKHCKDFPQQNIEDDTFHYVLDGGSLLQRIPWIIGSTFSSVCQTYIEYVSRKYMDATIVFDGYLTGPSTKDTAHLRRTRGICGPKVNFTEDMILTSKKEQFLSNNENKQSFIDLLSSKFENIGYKVIKACEDADLLIAQTAVQSAITKQTVLIGEDTDLLVLLLFQADPAANTLIFKSEKSKKVPRVWNINSLKEKIGRDTCQIMPVIHALTGCDATSRMFGIGKGVALHKISSTPMAVKFAKVFCCNSTRENIINAGERLIVHLYGGTENERLDDLRFRRFCEKAATSLVPVNVYSLPPTSDAASYHTLRVYYQVCQWTATVTDMQPHQWGWTTEKGRLMPVKNSKPPAPEQLLHVIRCSCKRDCESKRCSCRKHGLKCSVACGECRGLSCSNSAVVSCDDLDDDLQ